METESGCPIFLVIYRTEDKALAIVISCNCCCFFSFFLENWLVDKKLLAEEGSGFNSHPDLLIFCISWGTHGWILFSPLGQFPAQHSSFIEALLCTQTLLLTEWVSCIVNFSETVGTQKNTARSTGTKSVRVGGLSHFIGLALIDFPESEQPLNLSLVTAVLLSQPKDYSSLSFGNSISTHTGLVNKLVGRTVSFLTNNEYRKVTFRNGAYKSCTHYSNHIVELKLKQDTGH